MYADVYLPISIEKSFSYIVPDDLEKNIKVGQIVYVPFGNRLELAYINKINKNSHYKGRLKSIHKIASSSIADNNDIKKIIDWMERYYVTPKGVIIKNIFSHLLNKNFYLRNSNKKLLITNKGKSAVNSKLIKGGNRIKIMDFLYIQKEYIDTKNLSKISNNYNNSIKTLLRDEYIVIKEENINSDPLKDINYNERYSEINLSDEQNNIYQKLKKSKNFSVNLIHGVTGSGKTELYMKLSENILEDDKSVLILVPEIVLTPQTASRFKKHFGDNVGIWNSSMTLSEKKWVWDNINNKKIKIIIGTGSSIFLPMQNLGLIVNDQEHDYSYKQSEKMPTYNARDIAIMRSKNLRIPTILGSATPSLESYYNSINGKYNLYELKERYGGAIYPSIDLINMFKDSDGINTLFSPQLIKSIKNCLLKGEQIILLHNRRG